LAVVVAVAALGSSGCRKPEMTWGKPPIVVFTPGEWRSPKGAVTPAPAVANHAWRVLVLQETPRPKKNPHWKTIPIEASGALELPPGSRYRCVYNPVAFRAPTNEQASGVERWELLRSIRCSNDGWATYAQAIHEIVISPDGRSIARSIDQTELGLHEVIAGVPTDYTIALRAD
jgi:hypothetical protein